MRSMDTARRWCVAGSPTGSSADRHCLHLFGCSPQGLRAPLGQERLLSLLCVGDDELTIDALGAELDLIARAQGVEDHSLHHVGAYSKGINCAQRGQTQ